MASDDRVELVRDHLVDPVGHVIAGDDLAAVGVDHFAMAVHDVVVLDHVATDVEVVPFDLGLRVLDRLGDQAMLDRGFVVHPEAFHQTPDSISAKAPHQIVVE